MDKDGLKMCKVVQWMGAICMAIGIAILLSGDQEALPAGLGMTLLGGWGWFCYYQIPAHPNGLTGWRRWVVTPWLENAVRRDFLQQGSKDSSSTLHVAKRFTIFCFFGCLTLGFFGMDGLITAIVVGLGAAFLYEWWVRRKEAGQHRQRPD